MRSALFIAFSFVINLPLLGGLNPDIFLSPLEIADIKRKTKDHEWALKEYQELLTDADKLAGIDLEKEIPMRGGNWNFYYQSPQQHNLILGKQIGELQWEHIDKVTGNIYTGDESDIKRI